MLSSVLLCFSKRKLMLFAFVFLKYIYTVSLHMCFYVVSVSLGKSSAKKMNLMSLTSERCEVLVQQLFDTAAELVQGSEWENIGPWGS